MALAVFLAAGIVPAHAHADLAETVPAQGEAITTPPDELRLTFTEGVELAFSTVSIIGADENKVELGELSLDPADSKIVIVPIKAELSPGAYRVDWAVVSADGHKIEGSYELTVAP